MFYVGIDIDKYKHSKKDTNSEEGYNDLLSSLLTLDRSQGIKIGLEATGHYDLKRNTFLSKHGFDFIELNPLYGSRFHSKILLL